MKNYLQKTERTWFNSKKKMKIWTGGVDTVRCIFLSYSLGMSAFK